MVLGTQGRITLGLERCKDYNYNIGMKVSFVYEGNHTYRLVPEEDIVLSDRETGNSLIEPRYRIVIPKEIRDIYSKELICYGNKETGYLYIEFLSTKKEDVILQKLAEVYKAIEELSAKL